MDLNAQPDKNETLEIDFLEIVRSLFAYKWIILAITFFAVLGGVRVVLNRPVMYDTSALIQVKSASPTSQYGGLLGGFGSQSDQTDVEITLMKSSYILGPAIDKLGLAIHATPKYFPLIGNFMARHYHGEGPAPARLWANEDAWGGESIKVSDFNPSTAYYSRPYTLIAGEGDHYQLFDPDGHFVLKGTVGQVAQTAETNIVVSDLIARPGTVFYLSHAYPQDLINAIRPSIKIGEMGPSGSSSDNDTSSDTGIIQLSTENGNPTGSALLLNTIIELISQDAAHQKTAQTQNTLHFIENELPIAKKNLFDATLALNQYQAKTGTGSLAMESDMMLKRLGGLDNQITMLQLRRVQLLQTSTPLNPMVQGVDQQLKALQHEQASVQAQLAQLPLKDQQIIGLMREVQVQSKLYTTLLSAAQNATLAQAANSNDIRILSLASPLSAPSAGPVFFTLLISALLGCAGGCILVLIYIHLLTGIRDPYWVEKELGIRTLAILPFSKIQAKNKKAFDQAQITSIPILAHAAPDELCVESLRSLRTSVLFAMKENKSNVISIGGAVPATGKSFVSVNLAVVFADSGKRVLLIDADMRRGYLNQYFKLSHSPGLSEALTEVYSLEKTVRRTAVKNIDFMSTGLFPHNPSELLLHDRFRNLIDVVSKQYDVVIVDAPPILAVNDAGLIAQVCGINLLVISGGQLKARDIESAVRCFYIAGVKLHGTVFNFAKKAHQEVSAYPYRYTTYHKRDQQ